MCQLQVYSKVNQLYIYIFPFFSRFFSHLGYYRILSIFPCAIQQVLISYLFHIQQCVHVNPNLLIYPSPPHFPFGNHKFDFFVYLFFGFFFLHSEFIVCWLFFKNNIYFILLQLIYNILTISAVQQSDPVIYIYTYTFFLSHYPPSCSK